MNEAYAEWLVKRKTPIYWNLLKIVMVIVCVLSVVLGFRVPFGILFMIAAAIATYFVFLYSEVEYEYLCVSGQMSVDRILAKSKRKQEWEGTMEEIQIIAPSESYLLKDYEKPGMKILDYSSGRAEAKTYALISQKGSGTTKLIFEPNSKLLHCLKQAAPRKVFE